MTKLTFLFIYCNNHPVKVIIFLFRLIVWFGIFKKKKRIIFRD